MAIKQPTKLEHLGTPNTGMDGSPSFYRTDDGRFVAQGYKLAAADVREQLVNCPDHEDAVIITQDLVNLIAEHAEPQ